MSENYSYLIEISESVEPRASRGTLTETKRQSRNEEKTASLHQEKKNQSRGLKENPLILLPMLQLPSGPVSKIERFGTFKLIKERSIL